jgi:hypothetical protein
MLVEYYNRPFQAYQFQRYRSVEPVCGKRDKGSQVKLCVVDVEALARCFEMGSSKKAIMVMYFGFLFATGVNSVMRILGGY